MFNTKIYDKYDTFVQNNSSSIHTKLHCLEVFRMNEELLRDYSVNLSNLDKLQNEIGFHRLESEYNKMLYILKNFDSNNIKREIEKVLQYIDLLESYSEEINSISSRIKTINKLWESFKYRNEAIANSKFEESFMEDYNRTIEHLSNINLRDISSAIYRLDKLKEKTEKMIYVIEKINLYRDQFVFLGDKAINLKMEIEEILSFNELSGVEQISEYEKVINKVVELEQNSIYGVVGFPVFKALDKLNKEIQKYTISINGVLIKYEPFFRNKNIEYVATGEYVYFENYPKEGVFKGAEILSDLDISSKYIDSIVMYRGKAEKYIDYSIYVLSFFSFLAFWFSSLSLTIFTLFSVAGFFASYKFLLGKLKDMVEKDFYFEKIFVLKKISLSIFSIGENIDSKELLLEIFRNFDKTIEKELKGDYKWITKYQYQKNQ